MDARPKVIWDVLVAVCGANRDDFPGFEACAKNESLPIEYRFQGKLGFGGKIWIDRNRPFGEVSCYKEDETPERLEIIENTNELLASLCGNKKEGIKQ